MGEFTLQQPGYKIVSKLWIVVFILIDIVCAINLRRREKARQAARENNININDPTESTAKFNYDKWNIFVERALL